MYHIQVLKQIVPIQLLQAKKQPTATQKMGTEERIEGRTPPEVEFRSIFTGVSGSSQQVSEPIQLLRERVSPYVDSFPEEMLGNARGLVPDYHKFRVLRPDSIFTRGGRERRKMKKDAELEFTSSRAGKGDFSKLSSEEQDQISDDLRLAHHVYQNKTQTEYTVPPKNELPEALRSYYKEFGLLKFPSGLRAFIAKKDNGLTIAFAGAMNLWRQRNELISERGGGYSPTYEQAVGVVDALASHLPEGQTLRVTGHSLGGGLAQFATAANIKRHKGRISATTFNAAGLSLSTIAALKGKIKESQKVISNLRMEGDPVSPATGKEYFKGRLIGKVMTLPNLQGNKIISPSAHYIDAFYDPIDGEIGKRPRGRF